MSMAQHTARNIVPLATETGTSGAVIWLKYMWNSTKLIFTDLAFLGFLIAMPVGMYLFFSATNSVNVPHDVEMSVRKTIMVGMSTYGAMGAALTAGKLVQAERVNGWFRQLMLTRLTTTQFFTARAVSAIIVLLPAVIALEVTAGLTGVELPFESWFKLAGITVVTLLPFIVMGATIGMWVSQKAADASTMFVMLGMAMLGGLWTPLDFMPEFLQNIGKMLPSYWANELSRCAIPADGEHWVLPTSENIVRGIVTILVWLIIMIVLGFLGQKRALKNSAR